MPDSVVEEAIEVVITFLLEATFECPICDLSYAMYVHVMNKTTEISS